MASRVPKISAEELVDLLKAAQRPLSASEIVKKLGREFSDHETGRRRVREATSIARTLGFKICADTIHGLWLESRDGEFSEYLGRRRRRAVGELAAVSRSKRRAQGGPTLFDMNAPATAHGSDAFTGG